MNDMRSLSRRDVIRGGAGLGATSFATALASAAPVTLGKRVVPLPSADDIRRDYQRMVDFGPRLPGNAHHLAYVDWLAHEFRSLGLTLGPCDSYAYRRWEPRTFGLAVERDGAFHDLAKVAYYVRSAPTPPEGVTGALVWGGAMNPDGPAALGDVPKGAIVVFEAKLEAIDVRKLTDPVYLHVPEAERSTALSRPYKRLWRMPAFPLEAVLAKGAAGVVIVIDVSSEMIAGNFSPHASHYKPPLPALFVGQDHGASLRDAARAGSRARLTLDAQWVDGAVPSLTAILPGESEEVLVIDSHTDGQNFIEENGGIAMLQLARHFASLPKGRRLRRTLVFAGWPGHMSGGLPECAGWLRAHPDLVKRAAAAITIEHLGASEWEDVPGKGYAATGRNEYMNFATTAGVLTDWVREGFLKYDLRNHGIERGPGTTTGAPFHMSGVPHVGIICGPNYLLGIVPNGHIDKLDAPLAAKQTAMIAELIRRIDDIPAARLRASDPSLGAHPIVGPDSSVRGMCLR